jgi:hypothetical protein
LNRLCGKVFVGIKACLGSTTCILTNLPDLLWAGRILCNQAFETYPHHPAFPLDEAELASVLAYLLPDAADEARGRYAGDRVYRIQVLECPFGQQIGQRLISVAMGTKRYCKQSGGLRP